MRCHEGRRPQHPGEELRHHCLDVEALAALVMKLHEDCCPWQCFSHSLTSIACFVALYTNPGSFQSTTEPSTYQSYRMDPLFEKDFNFVRISQRYTGHGQLEMGRRERTCEQQVILCRLLLFKNKLLIVQLHLATVFWFV